MRKKLLQKCIRATAAIVFIAVVWWIAHVAVGNDWILPALSDCLREIFVLLGKGSFYQAFFATLLRVLLAFVISFLPALILAFIAYLLPAFADFFAPIVSVLRSLPTLAVLLIILVWTDAGTAPVVVAFLSLFPMLYAGALAALRGVDGDLIEMSRIYKVGWKKRVISLYLPSVAPYLAREGAAALSFALKLVVSAEVLAGTYGSLGGWLQESKLFLEMPTLFALVILTFATGLLLEALGAGLASALERRCK